MNLSWMCWAALGRWDVGLSVSDHSLEGGGRAGGVALPVTRVPLCSWGSEATSRGAWGAGVSQCLIKIDNDKL